MMLAVNPLFTLLPFLFQLITPAQSAFHHVSRDLHPRSLDCMTSIDTGILKNDVQLKYEEAQKALDGFKSKASSLMNAAPTPVQNWLKDNHFTFEKRDDDKNEPACNSDILKGACTWTDEVSNDDEQTGFPANLCIQCLGTKGGKCLIQVCKDGYQLVGDKGQIRGLRNRQGNQCVALPVTRDAGISCLM